MHGYISQQLSVLITLHYLQCLLFNCMPNFGSLSVILAFLLSLLSFFRPCNAVGLTSQTEKCATSEGYHGSKFMILL